MTRTGAFARSVVCSTALCLGGLFGPPGAALALLALPLPALVLGGVAGTPQTAAASAAVTTVLGVTIGWPVGASFLALVGLPAIVCVLLLRRAWPVEGVMGAVIGSMLIGSALLWGAFAPVGSSLSDAVTNAWTESFDATLKVYGELGMSADRLAELEAGQGEIARTMVGILPALLVTSIGAVWLLNLRVSRRWAGWPQLFGLPRWRCPEWMIWILIGSGFAMFAPDARLALVARNLFGVVLACYFCQGLAIVSYFLERYGLPRGVRFAAYAVIALQQVVAALVVALGVFDLWGDFRHLTARPADAAIGSDSDMR